MEGVKKISTFSQQNKITHSHLYLFERDTWRQEDTLVGRGKGTPVGKTGMTWSGFRPSDDACQYGYLVPSNMLCRNFRLYSRNFSDVLEDATIVAIAKNYKKRLKKARHPNI